MALRNTETLLSSVCLTGPLILNHVGDLEKAVNKLRQRYRTYVVEYDAEDGAVMLPNLFAADFGDQITRFATLTDQKNNKFDVLVERINGKIFFSKGWKALRGFYGLRLGAWISLVFVGGGQFAMVLKDRFGKVIKAPVFNPPMHFVIDRTNVQPSFNNALPPFTGNLTYRHCNTNMHIDHVKNLTENDVTSGFLAVAKIIYNTIGNSSVLMSNLVGPLEKMALANHPVNGLYFTATGGPEDLTITIISYEKILRIAMKTKKGFIDERKLKFCIEKAAEIIFKAAME